MVQIGTCGRHQPQSGRSRHHGRRTTWPWQNDGHLDVLALGVDQTQLGYSYIGAGAVLTELSLERAEADAEAAETAARAALAEQDAGPALGA